MLSITAVLHGNDADYLFDMRDKALCGRDLTAAITDQTDRELELLLASEPVRKPDADDVVVRINATPINPSDVGLLFGAADLSSATQSGISGQPAVAAPISPPAMRALAARVGVALSDGAPEEDGASAHINSLTALGMAETMRSEGRTALVHTAAASNLGQMLNRICMRDGIGLVNIVRNRKQAKLLKSIGASYICDSTLPSFFSDLTEALTATGATLAFDAIGGGKIAGQILTCMEAEVNWAGSGAAVAMAACWLETSGARGSPARNATCEGRISIQVTGLP